MFGLPKLSRKAIKRSVGRLFHGATSKKSTFYSAGFFIFYCIPFISIITLYSRIMKSLRRTRPGGQEQDNTTARNLHQNGVVMKVYVWIVSAFFICWTPLCVYIVLKKFLPASRFHNDPCMLLNGLLFYVFSNSEHSN